MKNKKGFTLIELLVAIVVLGIIFGLSLPLVRNIQARNEKKQYTTYLESIKYSAKLYVDSYEEDLFGHNESGCAIIKYAEMKDRNLLKDIQISNMSCATENTYVKVIKMKDKYSYAASIGCGSVKENGSISTDVRLPEEGIPGLDNCSLDTTNIMNITVDPEQSTTINNKRKNIKVKISSNTGIHENIDIDYGFSTTNTASISGITMKPLSIPIPKNQAKDIEEGKVIETISDTITTPEGVTGDYYLVLNIKRLANYIGTPWSNSEMDIQVFGPYRVDNTKPDLKNSTIISSNTEYNDIKPKLKLNATDNDLYSTVADLRMCTSYDSNTCSTDITDMKKKANGYIKYDANKVLDALPGGYNGSNHTIHVTVSDAAGNYVTKDFNYQVAQEYTLSYDSNGGNECNPKKKSVIFNVGTTKKWGDLCSTKRTGYTFTGWNTKKDGTGDTVTKDTVAAKNLTIYAQWRINKVYIKMDMNNGTLASTNTNYKANGSKVLFKNSENIHTLNYGTSLSTDGLANYNNTSHLNITRTGYSGKTGAEWNKKANGTGTSYDQNKAYAASEFCDASNGDCSVTLYVNWVANTYSLSYSDKGTCTTCPTSATYDKSFTVTNPSKSITVSLSLGSSGASINYSGSSFTNTSKALNYTFDGWKITGMDTVTHNYGTNTTTATSIAKTKATSFKNLRSTSGTVTFTGNWTGPTFTLPKITKTGYTCVWNSSELGNYNSGGTYTPSSATTRSFTAVCNPNTYKVTLDKNGADTAGTTAVWYQYNTTRKVGGEWCYYYTNSGVTNCLTNYTITKPTLSGYTFDGYYTEKQPSGTQTTKGTQYVNKNGVFINNVYQTTGDKTLYAAWWRYYYSTYNYCASGYPAYWEGDWVWSGWSLYSDTMTAAYGMRYCSGDSNTSSTQYMCTGTITQTGKFKVFVRTLYWDNYVYYHADTCVGAWSDWSTTWCDTSSSWCTSTWTWK